MIDKTVAIDYEPMAHQPDFIIDSPFSKWTQLQAGVLNDGCCTLVTTHGPYDLYPVERLAP